MVDEYTRPCLALEVARALRADEGLHRLAELFWHYGRPESVRSDHGPALTAKAVCQWLPQLEVGPLFHAPGRPWDNGYKERVNGQRRDERLNRDMFDTLREAHGLIAWWRQHYNPVRPHSA